MPTEPETADTGKSDVANAPFLFKAVYLTIIVVAFLAAVTALAHEATNIIEFVWRVT